MKLYGRRNSINVLPVLWTLDELALTYERRAVGGSFGMDADFLALNPNARIPVLDDDGFVLWESNAIIRYLFDVYGDGALGHREPRNRARNDQWMEWYKTTLYPVLIRLYQQFIRVEPEARDAREIDTLARTVGELLAVPEDELGRRPWLGGDSFGMGDIPLGVAIFRYHALPVQRPQLPNMDRWRARLGERSAYRSCVMRPFGLSPAEFLALEREDTGG
jgi:glutathione S-transferase